MMEDKRAVLLIEECRGVAARFILRSATEEPDHRHRRLLRARRNGPRSR
jgi:hypothetical protein